MKKTITLFIATFLLAMYSTKLNAQFITDGTPGQNKYGKTDAFPTNQKIYAIGIGDFTSFVPRAALHVNANLLDASLDFTQGELFRTTGSAILDNSWRMFTGVDNGIERFSITTQANSDDAWINTSQNGELRFSTNSIQRFKIANGSELSTEGYAGFGNNLDTSFVPQARIHLHQDIGDNNLQITNNSTGSTGTDGFRISVNHSNTPAVNGNGLIYNQEDKHLLFSTNASTDNSVFNSGGAAGSTLERMRITSVGAPTKIGGGVYGLYNPGGFLLNNTRVSISADPSVPVTRPLSLLHLGYNAGTTASGGAGSVDGWREWMEIGTFTSNGADNMYFGLKNEGATELQDAVIAWGDDDATYVTTDNLRFIFTADALGVGPEPSKAVNGMEIARMEATAASTISAPNYGMMGIGNFYNSGIPEVDAKLDIDGDLRIRQVTQDSTLLQVLVIDTSDLNRVHWKNISSGMDGAAGPTGADGLPCWDTNGNGNQDPSEDTNGDGNWDALDCQGVACWDLNGNGLQDNFEDTNGDSFVDMLDCHGEDGLAGPIGPAGPTGATGPQGLPGTGTVTADNGLSINTGTNVQLGQLNTNGAFLNGAELLNDREIPLNGKSFLFSGVGRLGLGSLGNAKMNIKNDPLLKSILLLETSSGYDVFDFRENKKLIINTELVSGEQAFFLHNKISNSPGSVAALYGLDVFTETDDIVNPYTSVRIRMSGISNQTITGLTVQAAAPADNGTSDYVGVAANANRGTTGENIGVYGQGFGSVSMNIGIKGRAGGGPGYAGYFVGSVNVIGALTIPTGPVTSSDNMFKTNQQSITNASNIISQLAPKTYNLDSANYTQLGFDTKLHMGLIAQEVELILPNLVSDNVVLAEKDTAGNIISPQVNYKGLNYQEFIPLLIAGMQEQQSLIDSLTDAVTALSDCVAEANICNTEVRPASSINDEGTVIQLENLNAIILDQNLPNPFAEKTTINYTIPQEVMEAQLLFYNMNGRIIKQMEITERGEGKLTVYGENLQKGIYTYSLIADGKLIATKKMVKQ